MFRRTHSYNLTDCNKVSNSFVALHDLSSLIFRCSGDLLADDKVNYKAHTRVINQDQSSGLNNGWKKVSMGERYNWLRVIHHSLKLQ